MTEKIITCITCPIGCAITVRGGGKEIFHIAGSQCKRGEEYARNEFVHPMRILTTTVKVEGAAEPLISVRSDKPIPRELLMQCMEKIKDTVVEAPVSRYDVILSDILGTGVNIIATGEGRQENCQIISYPSAIPDYIRKI